MSRNNAIPPLSRSPSFPRTSIAGTNDDCTGSTAEDTDSRLVLAESRVHDHSRPFPPPRLPVVHMATVPSVPPPPPPPSQSGGVTTASLPGTPTSHRVAPLTMPLTPLSSSFRSRSSLRRAQNAETLSVDANSRSLLSPSPADTTTMTTTTTTISSSPRSGEVSLATPRPDGERISNEYVETPFKNSRGNQERRLDTDSKATGDCPKNERRHRHHSHHHHHHHHRSHEDATVVPTHRTRGRGRNQGLRGTLTGASSTSTNATMVNTITKQPVSFTKEPNNTLGTRSYDPASLSIICDFCGRCRCEACREPPPLPSKWLCNNTCLCSAETVLDCVSCLCCVKGFFYHCVDGGSGGGVATNMDGEVATSCADEPCSCTGNRTTSKWACLGALTLVMPCLLCYWPLKGCVNLCEACYARHAAQGCRCNPSAVSGAGGRHQPIASDIGDSRDPEKRLLDPVTPEL